jgi:hypothetical protein
MNINQIPAVNFSMYYHCHIFNIFEKFQTLKIFSDRHVFIMERFTACCGKSA